MANEDALKFNAVQNAVEKYDADGDGKLSDLETVCKKYDTDGNGTFSMLEVEAIVKDLEIAKKEAKNMGRLAICIAFISVLVCAALLGLMFAANEASKESHVGSSTMKDLSGNDISTRNADLQTMIAISETPGWAPITVGEDTRSGKRINVGSVKRSRFLTAESNVKGKSMSGTVQYRMNEKSVKLFKYEVTSVTDLPNGGHELECHVDVSGVKRHYGSTCEKSAGECSIWMLGEPTAMTKRALSASEQQGGILEFERSLGCKGCPPPAPPPTPPPATPYPTPFPTPFPTQTLTKAPTQIPTKAPTKSPTKAPTDEPTKAPTDEPTEAPTASPTKPTQAPTRPPTNAGETYAPSKAPTATPTISPTEPPTEAAPTPTQLQVLRQLKSQSKTLEDLWPKLTDDTLEAAGRFMAQGQLPELLNLGLQGVTVDPGGMITKIVLPSSQITGPMPDFSKFTALRTLDLSSNDLSGELTLSLIEMKARGCTVSLRDNKGFTLPDMSNLADDINEIDLRHCSLTGTIPDLPVSPRFDVQEYFKGSWVKYPVEFSICAGTEFLPHYGMDPDYSWGKPAAGPDADFNPTVSCGYGCTWLGPQKTLDACTSKCFEFQSVEKNARGGHGLAGTVYATYNGRKGEQNNGHEGAEGDKNCACQNKCEGRRMETSYIYKTMFHFSDVYTIKRNTSLKGLMKLDLSSNDLSGELPLSLIEMKANAPACSEVMTISGGCSISLAKNGGFTLPDMSNLADIEELDLREMSLTGRMDDIQWPPHLTSLDLDFNGKYCVRRQCSNDGKTGLTGEIGDFSKYTALREISVRFNSLTGKIPDFVSYIRPPDQVVSYTGVR